MIFPYDLSQGWALTICSSILCILGSCIITIDDIYYAIFPKFITSRYPLKIKENYNFLKATLALSSGSILFTSLFRLLPESQKYLDESSKDENETSLKFYLIVSYISGIIVCLSFNLILHLITSQSVVHCAHNDHDGDDHGNHSINTSDSHHETEETPLIDGKTINHRKSIISKLLDGVEFDHESAGECRGYTSAELCAYLNLDDDPTELHYCEIPTLQQELFKKNYRDHEHHLQENYDDVQSNEHHHSHNHAQEDHGYEDHHHEDHHHDHNHSHARDEEEEIEHHNHNYYTHTNMNRSASRLSHHSHYNHSHHHHVNTARSRLLVIGIQTALAITLHKLPEGFITFVTSETNPDLGISIFLSLIVHNFVEGFSICLPLFYSMESSVKNPKFAAIAITSLLGGLSNPIGALFGYLFLLFNEDKYDMDKLNFIFGLTMAVTSGFLTVVGLSMFGSSISFGGNVNSSMTWCIIGIAIIGFSYVLK